MYNAKTKFIDDLTEKLVLNHPSELVNEIINIITVSLNDYDLNEKCTDIVVVDTESQVLLKKFLATKMVEGKSPKTIHRYDYLLTRMLKSLNMEVKDIDVFALRMYLAQLELNGMKAISVEGIRSVITSFFGWLHKEGFIETNPSANLGKVKCKKEIKKPFTKAEVEILKSNCDSLRDRAIIEFLLSTGCRVSEVCNVNINDINFEKQECKVLGKGNKERIVFINDVCKLHLKMYINSREDDHPALFIGKGTVRLEDGGIRCMFRKLSKKCGIENVHPHRFRRTVATSLINRGMQVQDVATVLGHNNINTTMTYIYSDIQDVKTAYNKYTM